MQLYGWGRYPGIDAKIAEPISNAGIAQVVQTSDARGDLIARGAGRSYGDSSLAGQVIDSRFLDNFLGLDTDSGIIECSAGVTLGQILDITVPKGWLLPVLPGTQFVSVGGAIASDVHGKNHHRDGCFSSFVESFSLLLASGEVVRCSAAENPALFQATCGGMGLTGVILDARLRLEKITSAFIAQRTTIAANLDEIFALFDEHSHSKYSVAWLDCLASGRKAGRSVLFTGEVADYGGLVNRDSGRLAAPPASPGALINRYTMRLFNSAYYALQQTARENNTLHLRNYFFPLDGIRNWNRLYGTRGFVQYQFVVPEDGAKEAIGTVLDEIAREGKGSFLSVLKKMGAQNPNFLSFPLRGYTLALDFKVEDSLFSLLDRLDRVVLEHGGRLYLAKDARMSRSLFRQTYPRWEAFEQLRRQVDPHNRFGSLQSRRLGLSD